MSPPPPWKSGFKARQSALLTTMLLHFSCNAFLVESLHTMGKENNFPIASPNSVTSPPRVLLPSLIHTGPVISGTRRHSETHVVHLPKFTAKCKSDSLTCVTSTCHGFVLVLTRGGSKRQKPSKAVCAAFSLFLSVQIRLRRGQRKPQDSSSHSTHGQWWGPRPMARAWKAPCPLPTLEGSVLRDRAGRNRSLA